MDVKLTFTSWIAFGFHLSYVMICRIQTIFALLDEAIPEANTELEYDGSDYTLLVAIVLSARSTDKQVNTATSCLFKIASTPEEMVELGYEKLCESINSVGLYKTKAKNIIRLSQILIDQYNSKVPLNREQLMELPGVGLKSANVFLNIVARLPTIPVDTHVFRVSRRLGLSTMTVRDKMSEELEAMLPEYLSHDMLLKAPHLLVLHGRYTCKAKPQCYKCPIAHLCNSSDKIEFAQKPSQESYDTYSEDL